MIHAGNVSRNITKLKGVEMLISFYKKHKQLYKDNNVEYLFLKTIGLTCALAGDGSRAREYYKKAIGIKKGYMIPYLGIILTYFGVRFTEFAIKLFGHISKKF